MNAQIIKLNDNYCFLRIDNYLNQYELADVWEEIKFLSYRRKFHIDTHTATDEHGKILSNKIGIWLDESYTKRNLCNYFKYYKKWLSTEAVNSLVDINLFWRTIFHCKNDTTLLSYYENNTYYKSHQDTVRITQLYYTFKEPKKFSGGQLVFNDFNFIQEIENNTLIVFPSWFKHEVKPVLLDKKTPDNQDKFECNGRYVFTTFFD